MMRRALAILLLWACGAVADIAPVLPWTVHTDRVATPQELRIVRGETLILETKWMNRGAALNLTGADRAELRYTAENPAGNTTYYAVTGTVHNASAGLTRVRWTSGAAPADDYVHYELAVISTNATVARAFGTLRFLPGVGDQADPALLELATLDFDALSIQNAASAPWALEVIAGAGVTVATNGTSYTVSAPGGAGDITGVDVSGGLLTGGGSSGDVTIGLSTNAVREAVHDPVDFIDEDGAPALFTLVNGAQEFNVNFSAWREAFDALYLSGTQGVSVANGELSIEDAGALVFATDDPAESGYVYIDNNQLMFLDPADNEHTIIHSGILPDITISIPVAGFSGPLKTDTVGWDWVQIDNANSTFIAQGFKTSSATQLGGTLSATIAIPTTATGWGSTALRWVGFGESLNSTDCKYDVTIIQHNNIMNERAVIYSFTNAAFTSVTERTTSSVAGGAMSTAPLAGGFLTIDVRLHTRNNLGSYLSIFEVRFAQ